MICRSVTSMHEPSGRTEWQKNKPASVRSAQRRDLDRQLRLLDILNASDKPQTTVQLAEIMDLHTHTVGALLRQLKKMRLVNHYWSQRTITDFGAGWVRR